MWFLLAVAWFIFGAYIQIRLCHDPMSERQRVVLAFLYWPGLFIEIAQAFLINVFVLFGGGWKAFKQYRKNVEEEAVEEMVQSLFVKRSK